MENIRRLGIFTKYVPFRCTPHMLLLLDAMAAQAEVSRSEIIKILILEGAEQRNITLEPVEVQNEKEG